MCVDVCKYACIYIHVFMFVTVDPVSRMAIAMLLLNLAFLPFCLLPENEVVEPRIGRLALQKLLIN